MNHTPTPWQLAGITTERLQGYQKSIDADFIHIKAEGYAAGGGIGLIHNKPNGVGVDNARFILTACNAHEELVEMLNYAFEELNFDGTFTAQEMTKTIDVVRERIAQLITTIEIEEGA